MDKPIIDPWDVAGTTVPQVYEYYGQILIDVNLMVFPGPKGSGQKPVLYDPEVHKDKQPYAEIHMTLDALPECRLQYQINSKWANFDADWTKITMPSIKELGFITADGACDLRKFSGAFIKLEKVQGFKKNVKNPEKGNYSTLKFTAVYKDLEECRKAWEKEHGPAQAVVDSLPSTEQTVPTPVPDQRATALAFIGSTITNARKSGKDSAEVIRIVGDFIDSNKPMCAGISVTDPEIISMINEAPF